MPISVRSPRSLAGLAPALRALVRAALVVEGRTAGEIGCVEIDVLILRSRHDAGQRRKTIRIRGADVNNAIDVPDAVRIHNGPGSRDPAVNYYASVAPRCAGMDMKSPEFNVAWETIIDIENSSPGGDRAGFIPGDKNAYLGQAAGL